ncbi:MAG: M48 family metalloprotease [Flavobacteriaceae bacterium]|nr:M48 family metalloprotease [Flavobacteriaceae bacterium]
MRGGNFKIKLLIGGAIILFSFLRYCSQSETNPYTGKNQHISLSTDDEIAIGLKSAPQMAQEYGGLHPDQEAQALVDQVGNKLVNSSVARETPYHYEFHLLRDPQTVNAFALPGGQVFITAGLFSRLKTEDQLAGVIGHEIGHVVGRHSAERIAKQNLTQGILTGVMAGSDQGGAQMAAMVANIVNMKYGREDELESDQLGVKFMIDAGYNPYEFIEVMKILEEASGGQQVPEFSSTHPSSPHRIQEIIDAIKKYGYTPPQ